MKVLILGGEGMLGHKAYQVLSQDLDVYATFLNFDEKLKRTGIFNEEKIFDKIDAFNFESIKKVINAVKPNYVFNCIGIIKQVKDSLSSKTIIYLNSLLPHLLAEYGPAAGYRLIHVSTDCIFSGKKCDYTEEDVSDAVDLYGRTKYLGEVEYDNNLTLRTSIIGRELFTSVSLVEWFLSQNNKTINGYANAIYTGLTTIAFCREVKRIITEYPNLSGLYHVSTFKIDKFQLLTLINKIYKLNIEIIKYEDFYCDRSLDSSKYRKTANYEPPNWEEMVNEMYRDKTSYQDWRNYGFK